MEDRIERLTEEEQVARARLEELRRKLDERERMIRALNDALDRDLDALFERDRAA